MHVGNAGGAAADRRRRARDARRRAPSCCASSSPGSRSRSRTSSPSPPSVFPEFTPAVAAARRRRDPGASWSSSWPAPRPRSKTSPSRPRRSSPTRGAFIYGANARARARRRRSIPAQRLGIFTQPAVIASHSGPTTTRLVKRGVFFTRKVMCLPLGAPPAGVDTTVPDDAGATERQRIESVHRASRAARAATRSSTRSASCRRTTTPIGRWRTTRRGPADRRQHLGRLPRRGPAQTRARRSKRCAASRARCASSSASRGSCSASTWAATSSRATTRCCARCSSSSPTDDEQDIVGMLRTLAGSATLLAAHGGAMRRAEQAHAARSDQALRPAGVRAHAGGARDGLRRRRHVRRARRAS